MPHWQVKPWPDAVAPAAVLDSIVAVFNRYIVLPKYAAEALALWILHAWTFDAGDISPFVVLTSPTKRCGKTSVLILLNWLTPRSELASNISPSAIFRYIQEQKPCLLIDEADSFLKSSEEARGILNSGHTKAAAYVIRNVEIGGDHKPQRFSTWSPKVIASIGGLAGTLEDRAIIIPMQRKPKGAKVARCRRRDCAEFADLRRQALRWATDNLETLKAARPALPDALNDRACDNWEPLLAIADLAGGEWARKARDAAKALSGDEVAADDDDGVELLHDIRAVFAATIHDAIFTKVMIAHLVAEPNARGPPMGVPVNRSLTGRSRSCSGRSESSPAPSDSMRRQRKDTSGRRSPKLGADTQKLARSPSKRVTDLVGRFPAVTTSQCR